MTNIHNGYRKRKKPSKALIHDFTKASPQLNKLYDRIDTAKIIYIQLNRICID